MDNESQLNSMLKRKNELLRRIEENKRLMELIRNPHIKDTLAPLNLMKRNIAIKRIQRYWRDRKRRKQRETTKKETSMDINKTFKRKGTSIVEMTFKVVLIQKAVRKFLSKRSRDRITMLYVDDQNKEFFKPLKFDRANQIKNEIMNNIRSREMPNKNTDFQEILNIYFSKYQKFNEEFPNHIYIRNDNFSKYYQCTQFLQYMNTQNTLDNLFKFDSFYLDRSKREQTKTKLNQILSSIEQKMWWYKYRDIDDFEENNIINEIDTHYNFERISDILEKKDPKHK